MSKLSLFTGLLALSCTASVFASGDMTASPAGLGTAPTANARTAKSAVKPRADGFTALPNKKGGSGVEVAYRVEGTPAVGTPLTIRIIMSSHGNADISLRAGEGLALDPQQQKGLLSKAGQSAEHSVTVVPLAEGRHYLHLISSAHGRASASSIAIQVGKGTVQSKPSGRVQTLPGGERIISVPAN